MFRSTNFKEHQPLIHTNRSHWPYKPHWLQDASLAEIFFTGIGRSHWPQASLAYCASLANTITIIKNIKLCVQDMISIQSGLHHYILCVSSYSLILLVWFSNQDHLLLHTSANKLLLQISVNNYLCKLSLSIFHQSLQPKLDSLQSKKLQTSASVFYSAI